MSKLLRRDNAVLDLHQVGGRGPYLPVVVSATGVSAAANQECPL
jgi:hypothetical protein